ncbi:MAG TPA: NBR1-Ig-like domain-containing protein [Anaerolineales bacterium]
MKTRLYLLPIAGLLAAVLACNLSPATSATLSPSDIETLSAQTLVAIQWQTLSAEGTVPSQGGLTQVASAGPNDTATNTLLPSVTPTVFVPIATYTPTASSTAVPCNWARFISDITIPDDWETTPSDHFTKTWRLQNAGSCTWTSGYSLVFDHGDQMSAPAAQQLTPGTVAPGGTIDVSVNLVSPNIAGTYQEYFKLRASDNSIFGIGNDANTAFWVKIKVNAILAPPVIAPTTQTVSATVTLAPGAAESATATCPAGTVVTAGGFSVGLDVWTYTQLKQGNGWIAYAKNNAAVNRNLTTYAICLTYPSASTTQIVTSLTVDGGHTGSKTADCPAGSVVTGGGYTGKQDGTLWTYASRSSGNSWQVSAKNSGALSTTFNIYAICLSGTTLTTVTVTGNKDIAPSDNGFAEVACPAGKVISGGGFGLSDDLIPYFSMFSSGYWRVYVHNTDGHTRAVVSYAMCLG